jgi:signal transduction histidine kinase
VSEEDRLRLEKLISAEQDERRRIALFLHDGPVQNLAGIALMLDAAINSIDEGRYDEARQVVDSAVERQRSIIRELRDLSFGLEPVVLRDQGIVPALGALAEHLGSSHELRIDLDVEAADELGESAQVALYTIIRELLDQSIHRGPPSCIQVQVTRAADGGADTRVADDAEPERRRRSFEAIEERVRQLKGEITVAAGESGGTEVRVSLPPAAARR